MQAIQTVALRDTQYTLQVEQVSVDSDLHLLRRRAQLTRPPASPTPG